jgi:ATP-dependent helicase HrpB
MPISVQTTLPVDPYLDEIVETVRRCRRLVVIAPPGAGKTTRIPPALAPLGRTILLQPRRVAARALTRRIAAERGWTAGNEIGWQIRMERNFNRSTGLLVATEGILTARLQSDPLLSEFAVVILDEFHERSMHADLALAMVRQAAAARDDLAIVVMSATMDPAPVASFLDAPVIHIDARTHPVETRYAPGLRFEEAVEETAAGARGHVLCFLPGKREIERATAALSHLHPLPLHGSLTVDQQERAIAPRGERQVILATNIAETSLTINGVTDVVDSGFQKTLRFDTATAVDHLVTERIARDSADQRAGRAGRTGPGRAVRLWDERSQLRAQREPEVQRIDLASTVLDILAWGADAAAFEWYEAPPAYRIEAAMALLERLGAVSGRKLTPFGAQIQSIPLHPRLAVVLLRSRGASEALRICAELADTDERELAAIGRRMRDGTPPPAADDTVLRALLAGYPDRVARRREPRSPRLLLASGTGGRLAPEAGVPENSEFMVALDVAGGAESLVRRASPIERSWLVPTRREVLHTMDAGRVRAVARTWYDEILLHEGPADADPKEAVRLAAEALRNSIDPALLLRLRFAQLEVDWDQLIATTGSTRLPHSLQRRLDAAAPERLSLPSGRTTALEYGDDGSVTASVKLQELFGLAETPRLGPSSTPVIFSLLAPNGRPVQVTRDLRSFWNGAYQEVRKELRGRYPKHPWPEDPWTARPTHRTKRR